MKKIRRLETSHVHNASRISLCQVGGKTTSVGSCSILLTSRGLRIEENSTSSPHYDGLRRPVLEFETSLTP